MKRQEYLDLKEEQRKEFEKFPIAYAFNGKQLEEAWSNQGGMRISIRTW